MSDNLTFRKTLLPNGVTVLTEHVPWVHSVALGLWVRSGSRHEPEGREGLTHLIEHMIYKGTATLTARDLAQAMDDIGGQFNAFTTHEHTCFSFKVLDEYFPRAFSLLSDILHHSAFRPDDLALEQRVIAEEIKMRKDEPDGYVFERFLENLWPDSPLGRTIAGTEEQVLRYTAGDVRAYYQGMLQPNRLVAAMAGSLSHDEMVEYVAQGFGHLDPGDELPAETAPGAKRALDFITRDNEQVHFVLGREGIAQLDDRRYTMFLLSTLFGGGFSSRLFQRIREELGLAYSVSAFADAFKDTGYFGIYASVSPQALNQTLREVVQLCGEIHEHGPEKHEVERAKAQLKSSLVMGRESASNRMYSIARQELYFGRYFTMEEVLQAVNAVTVEDVHAMAREFCNPAAFSLAAIGPVKADLLEPDLRSLLP